MPYTVYPSAHFNESDSKHLAKKVDNEFNGSQGVEWWRSNVDNDLSASGTTLSGSLDMATPITTPHLSPAIRQSMLKIAGCLLSPPELLPTHATMDLSACSSIFLPDMSDLIIPNLSGLSPTSKQSLPLGIESTFGFESFPAMFNTQIGFSGSPDGLINYKVDTSVDGTQKAMNQEQFPHQAKYSEASDITLEQYSSLDNWFDPNAVMLDSFFMDMPSFSSFPSEPQLSFQLPLVPVSLVPPVTTITFEPVDLAGHAPSTTSSMSNFSTPLPSSYVDKNRQVKELIISRPPSPEPSSSSLAISRQSSRASSPEESAGHSYKNNKRFRLPKDQMDWLKDVFNENPLPSASEAQKISDKLGVDVNKIKIWFQNRRAATKRRQQGK